MAKYQKYAKYKDSGVEWLVEIPSHWDAIRLKHLIVGNLVYGANEAAEDDNPNNPRYIRITDMNNDGSLDPNTFRSLPYHIAENYLLEDGDILLARSGATVGKSFLFKDEFGVSCFAGYLIRARPDCRKLNSQFAYWFFQSDSYWKYISGSQIQSTIQNVSAEKYGDLYLSLPEKLNHQKIIANFLNHETAKIDSLIAKQEKLIELLKEKRQAVISHAVTNGLNPDVSMKDSGVEWLGQVPEHWLTPRLKQLIKYGSSISYGIVQPGDPLDEGVPFIQTTNISKGSFALEDFQKTSVAIESNYPRSRLEGGEVILGIRASIGAAFVVPMSFKGVNLSRGIARIVPNNLLRADFLVWYFKSNAVDQYWGLSKQGSTFSEVSIETVKELNVVIPPLVEQADIAKYLTNESNKFEKLINSAETQKILLQERRTALISSAVTGKIDIRNWQHPNEAIIRALSP
ncbi:MAG: restriction endonuclease subunit S [Acinetobacter johnsonii]